MTSRTPNTAQSSRSSPAWESSVESVLTFFGPTRQECRVYAGNGINNTWEFWKDLKNVYLVKREGSKEPGGVKIDKERGRHV